MEEALAPIRPSLFRIGSPCDENHDLLQYAYDKISALFLEPSILTLADSLSHIDIWIAIGFYKNSKHFLLSNDNNDDLQTCCAAWLL